MMSEASAARCAVEAARGSRSSFAGACTAVLGGSAAAAGVRVLSANNPPRPTAEERRRVRDRVCGAALVAVQGWRDSALNVAWRRSSWCSLSAASRAAATEPVLVICGDEPAEGVARGSTLAASPLVACCSETGRPFCRSSSCCCICDCADRTALRRASMAESDSSTRW